MVGEIENAEVGEWQTRNVESVVHFMWVQVQVLSSVPIYATNF